MSFSTRVHPIVAIAFLACGDSSGPARIQETEATGLLFVARYDNPSQDMFYIQKDGLVLRRLTNDHQHQAQPAISPDGQTIAYTCGTVEQNHLCLMGINGGPPRQVTPPGNSDRRPAWSPDGTTLAFTRTVPGANGSTIWLVDTTGANARPLTALGEYSGFDEARFAPGGGGLVATAWQDGAPGVVLIDLGSGVITPVRRTGLQEQDAAWHPTRNRLAYVIRDVSGAHIEMRNTDGSGRITTNLARIKVLGREWRGKREAWDPEWSPDGREIAVTCNVGTPRLCRLNAQGTEITIIPGVPLPAYDPSWVR